MYNEVISIELIHGGYDEEMKNKGLDGIKVGKIRICNLTYADDTVLVTRNREALIDMDILRRFLKKRKLELCMKNAKIMVFNKKKKDKEIWKWGDKFIEKVQTFRYLRFMFNKKEIIIAIILGN